MREKVVQKLYQNGCTNIISLFRLGMVGGERWKPEKECFGWRWTQG